MNITKVTAAVLVASCGPALAEIPDSFGWPMEHIEITFDGNAVGAAAHTDAEHRIEMRRFNGVAYDGAASVLDGSYYSDQYGIVADGFISLGAGEFMWVERTSSSAGLSVYEGGMRMMREFHTYDAIFGTDGSSDRWMWGGTMVHNWFSAESAGEHEASFNIYVGDANGDALSQYTGASFTLYFNAVPAPSALGVLGLGVLGAARRKRGA